MKTPLVCFAMLLAAGSIHAGEPAVSKAVAQFEERAAKAPAPVAMDLRLMAAEALKERYPELARKVLDGVLAEVRSAGGRVATANTMGRLRQLAPDVKVTVEAAGARPEPPDRSIMQKIGTMRGLATDADRARLVLEVTPQIRALPAGAGKISLARGLAGVATEGDLGNAALTAVATTLLEALREAGGAGASADSYLEVASLVRYERVKTQGSDAALDAATALLELRDQILQGSDFTLAALDGKQYTLASLKGRIVLLNFWATWCPPCRKEMPDMEKLYRKYERAGLTVLAVSDEKRETVEGFLTKNPYSFPVLLDSDRKVHASFGVSGIPKSFIFDREGHLAAQAIDMRTEGQFVELLKRAGLE